VEQVTDFTGWVSLDVARKEASERSMAMVSRNYGGLAVQGEMTEEPTEAQVIHLPVADEPKSAIVA
jgi:hypothetical protein